MSTPAGAGAAPAAQPGGRPVGLAAEGERVADSERLRRWRLLLGSPASPSLGAALDSDGQAVDAALAALYDAGPRSGARPGQRGGRTAGLNRVMPETSKATARQVVAGVVAEVERRIANRTRAAVSGALNRAARSRRPRPRDIDWNRTIAANLSRYQPEHRTVIPERLVGYGRRQQVVARDVVLAIDQSGSMASSVVYASVFGAVLASIRALKTSLVVFDTAVVDLTEKLQDPVDVLFGTQLGGGTDINKAIAYSQTLITRPRDSIFVLISDLIEGGVRAQMLSRIAAMHAAGVRVAVLLALSDDGAPAFDGENAAALAGLGVPAFACTPDAFPDLLAVAIDGGDIAAWAHHHDLATRQPPLGHWEEQNEAVAYGGQGGTAWPRPS